MGKQSSRIYFQGKDHKDIYFRGKFHGKMYKNGQLLWEKLFPDDYFILIGDYKQGVGVICKEKKFYDMLPSAYNIGIIGNVGKTLVGICQKDKEEDSLIYSIDYGKTWKMFDSDLFYSAVYTSAFFTPSSRSFAFVDNEGMWSIARFSSGEFLDVIQTSFAYVQKGDEYIYRIVNGYSEYYSFYRTERNSETFRREIHIRNVDQNGNDIGGRTYAPGDRTAPLNNYPINGLWHAGESIYGFFGSDSSSYPNTCIVKLNENGVVAQYKLFSNRLSYVQLIYSDSKKTILEIEYRVYNPTAVRIYAFYSDSSQMISDMEEACVYIKIKDIQEYVKVNLAYVFNANYGEWYATLRTLADNGAGYGSCLYVKNGNMSTTDDNGICFYASAYMSPGYGEPTIQKKAVIYFDNIYLKESDGNYLEFIN